MIRVKSFSFQIGWVWRGRGLGLDGTETVSGSRTGKHQACAWAVDRCCMMVEAQRRPGLRWPYVLGACIAVIALLALTIWGLARTFGLGPHTKTLVGPVALTLAVGGFVALFAWARWQRAIYGLEESVDGALTPRWYIRAPILFAFLCLVLVSAYSQWWGVVLFGTPLAVAAAYIYRPGRLRPMRRAFNRQRQNTR